MSCPVAHRVLQQQLPASTAFRRIVRSFTGVRVSEGDGVQVRRTIGAVQGLRNYDPFLLLDEAEIVPPSGFPEHPHRGFETVSYILSGAVRHRDSRGHAGLLTAGGMQWMTAGRGILHEELPDGTATSHGLQLWVNLPAKLKMCEPRYQDFSADKLPTVQVYADSVDSGALQATVKVVAGASHGIHAPVEMNVPVVYADISVEPGATLYHPIPAGFNALVYVLSGSGTVEGTAGSRSTFYQLTIEGEGVRIAAGSSEQFRVLLIAGRPIGEPIVQRGPFVMNTEAEIQAAFSDFRKGRFGTWTV